MVIEILEILHFPALKTPLTQIYLERLTQDLLNEVLDTFIRHIQIELRRHGLDLKFSGIEYNDFELSSGQIWGL